jgi:hypothetical protein
LSLRYGCGFITKDVLPNLCFCGCDEEFDGFFIG